MQNFVQRFFSMPRLILLAILGITIFFFIAMSSNSRMETNLDKYMPQDHPAFVFSDEAEKMFGIEDGIIIAIENPKGIYQQSTLTKLRDLTLALQEMKGIKRDQVTSLFTAENIIGKKNSLEVAAFYKDIPTTQQALEKLRETVRKNEMVFGRMVSADETVTVIIAELEDTTFSQELYQKLLLVTQGFEGPERIHVAGRPIVEGTMALLAPKDMMIMVPIVLVVIVLVLLFVLRSTRAMLATMLVVFFSTIWAFGLMALLKVPIYAVSTMIPVMLIAIGVADGIHLFNYLNLYRRENSQVSLREAILVMVKRMWKPVVMTSVTTAIGFFSLLTSDVYPVKYFGIFTAFGVMAAMLLSLILIPAFSLAFGLPEAKQKKVKKKKTSNALVQNYHRVMKKYRWLTIGLVALIIAGSLLGIGQVWINSSFLDKFERDSEIVLTDAFINKHFGGTSTINVIFSSSHEGAFKQPEILRLMDQMQTNVVGRLAVVGNSFSVTDYLKRFNKVLHEDKNENYIIPNSVNENAQYLLLYEMSGDPENLWNVVDYEYKNANMVFQLKKDDSKTQRAVLAEVEDYRVRLESLGVTMRFAGSGYKSLVFSDLILEGQITSLVLSLVIVIILLSLLFKNILAGLIGSVPIIITAAVGFGIMGALNIAISTTTALISSIAVGVGIDYAVHFLEKYRQYARDTGDSEKTARLTIQTTGRAILFNATVVMAGFMVLLFSVFPPNRELGFLVSFNMFTSLVFTLSIMYVLLSMSRLWFGKKIPNGGIKCTKQNLG